MVTSWDEGRYGRKYSGTLCMVNKYRRVAWHVRIYLEGKKLRGMSGSGDSGGEGAILIHWHERPWE
jgi:hypothetical protein